MIDLAVAMTALGVGPALSKGVSVQPSIFTTPSGATAGLVPGVIPAFAPRGGVPGQEIVVRPGVLAQPFYGVGAALTESAAFNLWTYLTPAARTALLAEMFGTNGYSFVRICFGQSDFRITASTSTYDDVANDTTLANFSIAKDTAYIIPILQQILAINPQVKVIATAWYAPAWLMSGQSFIVSPANLTTWANYYVKSIQAYASYGIPIYAITPGNEPQNGFCNFSTSDMATFIGGYLGPALDAAGLGETPIWAGDTFWDTATSFISAAMSNPASAPYVKGGAFHGYSGSPLNMLQGMRQFQGRLETHFTEYRTLRDQQTLAQDTAIIAGDAVIANIRYGASSVTLWNMALDQNGQPTQASNVVRRGVVTVQNDGTGTITKNPEYWVLAHLGRFLRAGARRCGSTTFAIGSAGTDVQSLAFANPDGSVVVFLYNSATVSKLVTVTDAVTGMSTVVSMAVGDISTVTWGASAPVTAGVLQAPGAAALTSAASNALGIALAWTAPASQGGTALGGYVIMRFASSGAEIPISVVPASALTFQDSTAVLNLKYFYTVKAFGGGGYGPASNEMSATYSIALAATGLSKAAAVAGQLFTASVTGGQPGSTFAVTSSDGTVLSVSGTTVTGVFSAQGTPTLSIAETNSKAVNSPNTTPLVASVGASVPLSKDSVASAAGTANANSVAWTHSLAAGANLLVVGLASSVPGNTVNGAIVDVATTNSVTAGGVAMTKLSSIFSSGSPGYERNTEIWYLQNPPTGAVSIIANTPQPAVANNLPPTTYGTSVSFLNSIASPFGAVAKASTTTSAGAATESITSAGSGSAPIVFALTAVRSNAAITLGTGQTQVAAGLAGTNVQCAATTQPGGASITSSFSWGIADQAALMAVQVLSA